MGTVGAAARGPPGDEAARPEAVEVQVVGLAGAVCSFALDPGARVAEAKAAVQAAVGVPVAQQRLISSTKELRDTELVDAAGRHAQGTIELTLLYRNPEQVGWIEKIANGRLTLEDAPEHIRNDPDVVLTAIDHVGGLQLFYASEALKRDRNIVIAAVSAHGRALMHAAEELRGDREVVIAAVSQLPGALSYAPADFQGDREFILECVSRNGLALKEFHNFQFDREVVLAAISQNGGAVRYASEFLRQEREVMLAALSQRGLLPESTDEDQLELAVETMMKRDAFTEQFGLEPPAGFEQIPFDPSEGFEDPFLMEYLMASLDRQKTLYPMDPWLFDMDEYIAARLAEQQW